MVLKSVERRWNDAGHTCIVAAPGPSLTPAVADRCKGLNAVVVKEAYRIFPWADAMYGCDTKFWDRRNGCPDFVGEKWSSHDDDNNNKFDTAEKYGLRLVRGYQGEGFSFDQNVIHYGSNSGFQAI